MSDNDAGTENAAPDAVMITVNGVEVAARPGRLLIDACDDAGVHVPRFCYHERMRPVGMCRMCLVDVDTGRGPALQPSCMLPVSPGMVVDTESAATKKAQDGVLEFLLVNHPLDCPVCDKGGECPLQDQTMSYGPGESRFVEEKRHYEKPIPINDNVYLDRERCILCDRCTRFAKEVAGDPLIHFQDRGNATQVNTFPDHPFASYFSGNVVQICPVGALTAKPYRFKARPWDLEEVDSTYPNPMGDRVNLQSSRNRLLRVQGVDSDAVNHGWMSDRDRFGFEAFDSEDRLTEPLIRGNGLNTADPAGSDLVQASWSQALGAAAGALEEALDTGGPASIGVLGGARLTNEAQYAWAKLAKGVLGTDNVDAQLADGLAPELVFSFARATIERACRPGGVVVLLGPDPKEEFGTLFLRLRHAITNDGVDLIELTPTATGMSSLASARLHARPGEVGHVAAALVSGDAAGDIGGVSADALRAAHALLGDRPVTVLLGRGSLAESTAATTDAAAALASLPDVAVLPLLRRGNINGALDLGLAPGLLPGRATIADAGDRFRSAWGRLPSATGLGARELLEAAAAGRIAVLVLLGCDPLTDFPDPSLALRALAAVDTVIAVDLFVTESVQRAQVVLPAAGFGEVVGSHTNLEARITILNQKVTPPGTARPDWMIAAELAFRLGADLGIESPADVWTQLGELSDLHAGLDLGVIAASPDGVVVAPDPTSALVPADSPVAVRPVDAYALRLVTGRRMYDGGTLVTHAPSLAGLVTSAQLLLNPYDFDRLGVASGEEVRVKRADDDSRNLAVPAVADPGVPRGVARIDYNQPGADPRALFDLDAASIDVRVETT
ncbi:MAG: NADH-quinone oxidoreductase subunit NuoG [Acidimicrobiales bacterium]|nr:NADH-quinone oxidoreductase subunit NuoG [Acidimicrobiales bacterium]